MKATGSVTTACSIKSSLPAKIYKRRYNTRRMAFSSAGNQLQHFQIKKISTMDRKRLTFHHIPATKMGYKNLLYHLLILDGKQEFR